MRTKITPPDNATVFESEIATLWFDEEGILNSISKSPVRTIENLKANIELVKRISNNEKKCVLVYLSNSPRPDKKTRMYVANQLAGIYKAMALVSEGGLGKFIMNFLFALNAPPVPMKTFSNAEEARQWLRSYL